MESSAILGHSGCVVLELQCFCSYHRLSEFGLKALKQFCFIPADSVHTVNSLNAEAPIRWEPMQIIKNPINDSTLKAHNENV